jgi:hypothetical protein
MSDFLYESDYLVIKIPAVLERALLVAQVAKKILLIVSADKIYRKLKDVMILWPCKCGNFGNHGRKCSCQMQEIEKNQREIGDVSNAVRVDVEILWRDFVFTEQIDGAAKCFLKQIYAENGPTCAEIINLVEIAAAIQKTEKSERMQAVHIAEAFSYRTRK